MEQHLWLHFYRVMTRIRAFERAAYELYTGGRLPGFLHLSIGQEAISTGACSALRADDSMASTHRGHGDTIAKGVSVEAAMAELFGRVTGTSKGKGGSMHIADFSQGILGANGIIAAGVPIAVGAALSAKYRKTDQVALAFFGDGATGSGPLHEGMNMAMLWQLPMIFVRQNNRYAESTPMAEHTGIADVVEWARGYGMPAYRLDGNNVVEVYEAVCSAVERGRRGGGPTFFDCETYRWYGHNIGDPGTWRPKDEVESWRARDPIAQHQQRILDAQIATLEQLETIEQEEQDRMDAAIASAEAAPTPRPEQAMEDLYVDSALGAMALKSVRP